MSDDRAKLAGDLRRASELLLQMYPLLTPEDAHPNHRVVADIIADVIDTLEAPQIIKVPHTYLTVSGATNHEGKRLILYRPKPANPSELIGAYRPIGEFVDTQENYEVVVGACEAYNNLRNDEE